MTEGKELDTKDYQKRNWELFGGLGWVNDRAEQNTRSTFT